MIWVVVPWWDAIVLEHFGSILISSNGVSQRLFDLSQTAFFFPGVSLSLSELTGRADAGRRQEISSGRQIHHEAQWTFD